MPAVVKQYRDDYAAVPATYAAQIMTPNPVSIGKDTTIKEVAAFLTKRGFSAAPVIDAAGRFVGVVSGADIVRHVRDDSADVGRNPYATVRDIMSRDVLFVRPDTPLATVIDILLEQKVRRLFVVDNDGVLIGVISIFDVLRRVSRQNLANDAAATKRSITDDQL